MAKAAGKAVQSKAAPAPSESLSRGTVMIGVLALAVVAFVAYLPALRGPFLFDDLALPYGRPNAATAPYGSFLSGVRPLLYSTFWLETRVWGTEPFGYHVVNLLLHLANGLMAGWLVFRILGFAGEKGLRRWILSGFAMAAFLLHPLQTEAVAYIASRSEALSVFFFFAAVVTYMASAEAGVSWLRTVTLLLLWALAMATKEHVFVFPFFLALTDFFWNPGFSVAGLRRNWRIYVLFPLIAVAGLLLLRRALGDTATVGFNLPGIAWWQYFLTQCKTLWVYLRLVLLPVGQNLDHGFPVVKSAADPMAWLGFAGLLCTGAICWWKRKEYPLAAYGFFAFVVLMAPTSSFLPILDSLVERRLYLSFVGLLFIVLEALRRWKASTGALTATLGVVAALMAVLSFQRNYVYGSTIAMWEDSVAGNPHNDRSYFQLGYAYYREGRCADAVRSYERVAKLRAPDYTLQLDWALALDCAGQSDAAVAKIKEAIATERTAHSLAVLGMIQGKAGRNEDGLRALQDAEKADPSFAMTYVYRGTIYYNLRQYAEAADAFRKAVAVDPGNEEARQKLAQAEAAAR